MGQGYLDKEQPRDRKQCKTLRQEHSSGRVKTWVVKGERPGQGMISSERCMESCGEAPSAMSGAWQVHRK